MEQKIINKILQETEDGYNRISRKFSETRKFFWRDLEFIKDCAKDGDKILDFGCGNGRLLEVLLPKVKPSEYVGADSSQRLIDIAGSKYSGENIKFLKINPSQVTLPFSDNYFNVVYSIAVFHHFPKEHAEKMAGEIHRIIKPGGYAVITVWNLWSACSPRFGPPRLGEAGEARRQGKPSTAGRQKKYLKNILKNWLDKIMGESALDWNDCYISFKDNEGKVFQRYHRAYTASELRKIFIRSGLNVKKCETAGGKNIVLIVKKD